jgi:hypothetical protein
LEGEILPSCPSLVSAATATAATSRASLGEDGLEPAGSVSLGLSSEGRERLRAALEAGELPHRRRRQRVRPVEPAVVATVDFHRPARGPVRDAVLRSVELHLADRRMSGETLPASYRQREEQ